MAATPEPLPDISEQHLSFVQEYIKDRNATRAILAVGLSGGYFAAAQMGSWLLKKPEIQTWVRHLTKEAAKRLRFRPEKVTRNWMLAATADLDCFEVTNDGELKTKKGVPREYLRTVRKKKMKRTERLNEDNELVIETTVEIELRDPFGPEKELMAHFGAAPGRTAGGKVVNLPPKEDPPQ